MIRSALLLISYPFLVLVLFSACTNDELNEIVQPDGTETIDSTEQETETEEDGSPPEQPAPEETACTNASDFIFNEKDGLVLVEFEKAEFTENWKLKTNGTSYSGEGYMVWDGAQSLGNPGNGAATYKLKIENAGTYQFLWHSAVTIGDNGTEHNDTWLRFNDATDFYGQKSQGANTVYPKGTGKTPNPEGATKEGWFKIYRSGNNLDFKWQASTYDNDAHDVFIVFDTPGTYLMEISARSSGHGIDKFVLFNSSVNRADAIASETFSAITCD